MKSLDLLNFMPFRFNRLAVEFSNALAADYRRFGIDIPEWRVIATLGEQMTQRSANYVVKSTRTHKTRISRAVANLEALGVVEKVESAADRRELMLRLTAKGRTMYRTLVPLLLDREQQILSALSAEESKDLSRLLGKLEHAFGLIGCDA